MSRAKYKQLDANKYWENKKFPQGRGITKDLSKKNSLSQNHIEIGNYFEFHDALSFCNWYMLPVDLTYFLITCCFIQSSLIYWLNMTS